VGVIFQRLTNHWEEAQRYEALTLREREVLVSIAQGLSNVDIAARLGLTDHTIQTHRERLHTKLSLRGAAALTRFAVAQGLISALL
jgi:DNA-binding NarL/FixJ family response regulator